MEDLLNEIRKEVESCGFEIKHDDNIFISYDWGNKNNLLGIPEFNLTFSYSGKTLSYSKYVFDKKQLNYMGEIYHEYDIELTTETVQLFVSIITGVLFMTR